MHEGITHSKERKSTHIYIESRGLERGDKRENRQEKREGRYAKGYQNGRFAADAVHQDARWNGDNEEPHESYGDHDAAQGVVELQLLLHIIGANADHIGKAHREKAEHHHKDGSKFGFSIHIARVFSTMDGAREVAGEARSIPERSSFPKGRNGGTAQGQEVRQTHFI